MTEQIENGFIVLARKILASRAWIACNHEQKAMLITTLLMANHKEHPWWNGTGFLTIPRGSFVTSSDRFAELTKTSRRKVRTFWNKLGNIGFLTIITTNKYSIINVCNYDTYQKIESYKRPADRPPERPATDQQPTTNNKENNDKEYLSDGSHKPSIAEIEAYGKEIGSPADPKQFFDYYESIGWKRNKNKITDWKACFRGWEQRPEKSTSPIREGF